MSNILVTGGAGFIGSHVVDALLARGDRVLVLDDLSSGNRLNLHPQAELIEGDLRDGVLLQSIFDRGIDMVSHHAAQISVRHSVDDPAFDAEVNIIGSLRLAEAAMRGGVKRFIFASSGGAIYGDSNGPSREEDPAHPVSPYGCAKLSFEHYLHYYSAAHGMSWTSLRYSNVYGPRQNSLGEAGVIAIFCERLLRDQTLFVNGSGEQTRDYVFVEDVVKANLAAVDGQLDGAFNVGTGVETSVNRIVQLLEQVSKKSAKVEHLEAKKGEQLRNVLDGRKLHGRASLPEPVALSDGLQRTWRWFAERAAS